MRLAAQARGGYYAAAPPAVAKALEFLRPPKSGPLTILDPCCGEAFALEQLAQGLGCKPEHTYGIELEASRADASRERLPESNILGPADYFGTGITFRSFSFIWCNPPFDDKIGGGGRVETQFVERSTDLLTTDGVLALVCPESVLKNPALRRHLLTHYDDLSVTTFPEDHRPYNEVIVFGIKRERGHDVVSTWDFEDDCPWVEPGGGVYHLPAVKRLPSRFCKLGLTPEELSEAIYASPLHRMLAEHHEPPVRRPPLPLGKGHRALLLTAGHLDGVVSPPGELPHVVRGTARKITYVSNTEVREKDDGSMDTVVTHSQKITLVVRVLDAAGNITTFSQEPDDLEIVSDEPHCNNGIDDQSGDPEEAAA
jgi:hypothetical protein